MSLFVSAFPLQRRWELWHFSEGVKSQSLCLPFKPNMHMHLPSVCEGTAPNLPRSLVESRMEGGDGRRTPLLLSTLAQDLLQALHCCLCHQRNPVVISPARRLREVKNLPPGPVLPAYSARSSFQVNHSTCRTLVQRITRKNLESQKKLLLLLGLQFSSLHSCAPRNWPHCTERTDSFLCIILAFNSWLHRTVTTLLKKDRYLCNSLKAVFLLVRLCYMYPKRRKRKQESVGQQEKSHLLLECKMSSFIREVSKVHFSPKKKTEGRIYSTSSPFSSTC